jgi:hypothetical protein
MFRISLVLIALSFAGVNHAQAQEGLPGSLGTATPGNNNMLWESTCPAGTRPISGTCNVEGPSTAPETLHSFGYDAGMNAWACNWTAPVKAHVVAWCAKIPGG